VENDLYVGTFREGMSKTTRGLNQNSRPTNKELKSEHTGCQADLTCEFLDKLREYGALKENCFIFMVLIIIIIIIIIVLFD
jgi:hypothetical protein